MVVLEANVEDAIDVTLGPAFVEVVCVARTTSYTAFNVVVDSSSDTVDTVFNKDAEIDATSDVVIGARLERDEYE